MAALQQTVSDALTQWLEANKTEILTLAREAVLARIAAGRKPEQNVAPKRELLTVAELAERWRYHPESVRRMLRQGRISRIIMGRQNRIALADVESLERSGAIPNWIGKH